VDIKKVAALLGGTIDGKSDVDITGLAGIESAKPGDMTFAADESKLTAAEKSGASCVLAPASIRKSSKPLIRVENPKLAFLMAYNAMHTREVRPAFVHPQSYVAATAKIGKDVWIGPHVSIEDDVRIGDGTIVEANSVIKKGSEIGSLCRIYPNVTLYENTRLGKNVIIHSGSVLGADGFGYVKDKGRIYKFPQAGRVIVEDDVEIGANTAIDRGSLGDTIVGAGTKIDNLCQIAHNVKIGKNCLIAGLTGISGSCVIGDNVIMAGNVGIADNTTIQEDAIIAAKSGVIGLIRKGEIVWGYPAKPIREMKQQIATLSWITKNFDRLSKLMKQIS